MRSLKRWLLGVSLLAILGGGILLGTSPSLAQPTPGQERRAERNYWRHHDGRWNYWDAADKRWYYTDGSHWYYNNGKAWNLYRFDKTFGREGFERGPYAPPAAGVNVVTPTHQIYVAPR